MAPVHSLRKCGRVLYAVSRAVLYDSVHIVLHFHNTYQEENESGVMFFVAMLMTSALVYARNLLTCFRFAIHLRLRHVFCFVRQWKEICLSSVFIFDCNEKWLRQVRPFIPIMCTYKACKKHRKNMDISCLQSRGRACLFLVLTSMLSYVTTSSRLLPYCEHYCQLLLFCCCCCCC